MLTNSYRGSRAIKSDSVIVNTSGHLDELEKEGSKSITTQTVLTDYCTHTGTTMNATSYSDGNDEGVLGQNYRLKAHVNHINDNEDRRPYETNHCDLELLKRGGKRLRSDLDQPNLAIKPDWFDESLFENAKTVYARHFMGINFAHLSGLILLVRITSIYRTLNSTGRSDSVSKLFRRYYQTLVHVKKWYEGNIFDKDSDAFRSLLTVRGMHNRTSATLNDARNGRACENRTNHQEQENSTCLGKTDKTSNEHGGDDQDLVHISQFDIMLTQFAFIGFIVTRPKNVGLIEEFSQFDLESLVHFWRVIGYYLGACDEYNLCSRRPDDVEVLCKSIMESELKRSIRENHNSTPPAIMGLNIVRSVKFIPMLTFYGITKYLFELMDLDTSELEPKSTRYSRLSYTLIKLVMSHLLAYRPFRWFNNGLTRLSIFCVGKIEVWFENHLHTKYG